MERRFLAEPERILRPRVVDPGTQGGDVNEDVVVRVEPFGSREALLGELGVPPLLGEPIPALEGQKLVVSDAGQPLSWIG